MPKHGSRCPNCHGDLDHLEQSQWLMNLCVQCGILWMEGNNLAHTIQHLHLTENDSEKAFCELGTILRREVRGSNSLSTQVTVTK